MTLTQQLQAEPLACNILQNSNRKPLAGSFDATIFNQSRYVKSSWSNFCNTLRNRGSRRQKGGYALKLFRAKWMRYALLAVTVVAVVACSGVESEDANTADRTRTIEHALGKTEVPQDPERVVTLTNESTDHVLALGIKPVGAVQSWLGDPYYDYIADELQGVPTVGEELQPNLEKIVELNPDLILANKTRHEKIYSQLSAIAPTVVSKSLGDGWKENLHLYGKALNRESKVEELMSAWKKRINNFQTKMEAQAKLKGKNCLNQEVSLIRFLPGAVRIHHQDNFAGRILDEIGFQRPPFQLKDKFATEVSYEQIPRMDGEILFYMKFTNADGEVSNTVKKWMSHPLWQKLNVVQKGDVYEVKDVYWNTGAGIKAANRMLDSLYQIFLNDSTPKC